jgi:SAM-dependent methyltransferase/uncharacterized protein YbaR (Trm112 family)
VPTAALTTTACTRTAGRPADKRSWRRWNLPARRYDARLLALLACPRCGGKLTWIELPETPERAVGTEGVLACPATHRFPVIGGVPRFLRGQLFVALQRRYPDYFKRSDPSLWRHSDDDGLGRGNDTLLLETIERFGYEWTTYADYDAENFARFLEPVRSQLAPGMVALDAGCGAGRHLTALAASGLEVVGVDVSWAVESAAWETRNHPGIHVVQADLCRLPFRGPTFDFVYSLGVLHHLPDPGRGVAALVEHLRPGGFFLAWVYMRTPRKVLLEPLRRLAGLAPPRVIGGASLLLASAEYGLVIGPYAWLCRAFGRPVLRGLVPRRIREYAGFGFRVSRIDWYDRLAAPVSLPMTRAQAEALLALPRLREQAVTPVDDSWWQCYARVPT